jgi:hypothetical protein
MFSFGDAPLNKSGEALFITVGIPPVKGRHPCEFVHTAVQEIVRTAGQYDQHFSLLPLWTDKTRAPPIVASNPSGFPHDYTRLCAYIDVPNDSQMKWARGVDRATGKKREQAKVYATLLMNSKIDPRFLVEALTPIMDMKHFFFAVKHLQRIRTVSPWALGGTSPDVCPVGLAEVLRMALEEELSRARVGSKLADIDEVPEFVIQVKALRVPSIDSADKLGLTNLEAYSTMLRRAPHIEVSQYEEEELSLLLLAAEYSGLLKLYISSKCRLIDLSMKRNTTRPDKLNKHKKVDGHMGYLANTATVEAPSITDLFRKVPVAMEPLEDGSVPARPFKFTSVHREMTSYESADGLQLIDSMIPVRSGPSEGKTTVVFRQSGDAEQLATAFATDPAPWIFHTCRKKGYRLDMCHSLLKSFDHIARSVALETEWDDENWVVVNPNRALSDTWAEDLEREGYLLSDCDLAQTPVVSQYLATADQALVVEKFNLNTASDATLATRDGISLLDDMSHATNGNSSLRSVTTIDANRDFEAKCLAAAAEKEKAAAARYSSQPSDSQPNPVTRQIHVPNHPWGVAEYFLYHHIDNRFYEHASTTTHDAYRADGREVDSIPLNAVQVEVFQQGPLLYVAKHGAPLQWTTVTTTSPPINVPNSTRNQSDSQSFVGQHGEPASLKQSGLGIEPSPPLMGEGAGGPRGPN